MKKSIKNKWLIKMVAAFTILLASAFTYAEELRVGVDTDFAPFEFKGKDGKYTGFDIDLWDAIAKRLSIEYKLIPMDFEGLIPALTTESIDVALAAIFIKSSREKVIDFSHPYFRAGLKIMVRIENQDIKNPEDLKGKVVSVKTGTATVDYVETLGTRKLVKYSNVDNVYLEVVSGGVDAAVHDTPNVLYYINTVGKGRVKAVGADIKIAYYGIAFPEGSELRNKVNVALLECVEQGEYDQIYFKWFGAAPK